MLTKLEMRTISAAIRKAFDSAYDDLVDNPALSTRATLKAIDAILLIQGEADRWDALASHDDALDQERCT